MSVHRLLIVAVSDPTNDFVDAHVVLANVSENIPDLFQIGGGRLTMESAVWRLVRIAQQYCFYGQSGWSARTEMAAGFAALLEMLDGLLPKIQRATPKLEKTYSRICTLGFLHSI